MDNLTRELESILNWKFWNQKYSNFKFKVVWGESGSKWGSVSVHTIADIDSAMPQLHLWSMWSVPES